MISIKTMLIPIQKHKFLEQLARVLLAKGLIENHQKISQEEADALANEVKHSSGDKQMGSQ